MVNYKKREGLSAKCCVVLISKGSKKERIGGKVGVACVNVGLSGPVGTLPLHVEYVLSGRSLPMANKRSLLGVSLCEEREETAYCLSFLLLMGRYSLAWKNSGYTKENRVDGHRSRRG